jgi:hypothetical protein
MAFLRDTGERDKESATARSVSFARALAGALVDWILIGTIGKQSVT